MIRIYTSVSSTIYSEPGLPAVLHSKLLHFVWTCRRVRLFHGVFSPVCELYAKASADFDKRLLPVNRVVMLFSLLIIVSRLCQSKRKLRAMQKSGDRGCAGQARSEVGTLIALM